MSNIPLTDLRIGNLVLSNRKNSIENMIEKIYGNDLYPITLTAMDIFQIAQDDQKKVFGILISGELLERFGMNGLWEGADNVAFELPGTWNFYFDHQFNCFRTHEDALQVSKICSYVHDIQNCFYFLTGTELTIKQ